MRPIIKKSLLFIGTLLVVILTAISTLPFFEAGSKGIGLIDALNRLSIPLLIWRLSLLILFILAWPRLVRSKAKGKQWDEQRISQVINLRWRIALWLIIFDILFVEDLIGNFFRII